MRLYDNRNSGAVTLDRGDRAPITLPVPAKRGDGTLLQIQFHRDGLAELPVDPLITFILKRLDDFPGPSIVLCQTFSAPIDDDGFYQGRPNFAAAEISDLLVDGTLGETVATATARKALVGKPNGYIVKQSDDGSYWQLIDAAQIAVDAGWGVAPQKDSVTVGGEIVLQESPEFEDETSQSFEVEIFNDYYKHGESAPAGAPPFSRGVVVNRYDITSLTGGAATALDSLATAGKNDVGSLLAIDVDGTALLWRLRQLAITGINIAAAAVVTTARKHGLTSGATVAIGGSNSTPAIDGTRVVTVLSATTFSVPVTTTVVGTLGFATPTEDTASGRVRPDDFNAVTNAKFWSLVPLRFSLGVVSDGIAYLAPTGDNDTAILGNRFLPYATAQAAVDDGATVLSLLPRSSGNYGGLAASAALDLTLLGINAAKCNLGTVTSTAAVTLRGNGAGMVSASVVTSGASGGTGTDGQAAHAIVLSDINVPNALAIGGSGGDGQTATYPDAAGNAGNGGAGAAITATRCALGTASTAGGNAGTGGTGNTGDVGGTGGAGGNGGNGGANGVLTLHDCTVVDFSFAGGLAGGAGAGGTGGGGTGSPGTAGAAGTTSATEIWDTIVTNPPSGSPTYRGVIEAGVFIATQN